MSYVKYETLLKKHQPKIYDELYTNTRQLSIKIIKKRMEKELDVYDFSRVLNLTPEEYLCYEYGKAELKISDYNELMNKIDNLGILELFEAKMNKETKKFESVKEFNPSELSFHVLLKTEENKTTRTHKSGCKKNKNIRHSVFKPRNGVSMNEKYVSVR
ncbi:hypothetical protein EZ054_03130 [Enterococcus faecalis]|uniref:hypothetical protein n=2 Tax=Enterococcus faecalis TaxID=1351 RepID=UPI0012E1F95D|nr:hypothetical protein [Enterococcus faecalis]MUN81913.1 hypothetical protein [Enterococcus faecalis]